MSDAPVVLGVLGDFGGRPRDGRRRFRRVDRDDFDAVLAAAGVSFEATVPNRLVPRTEPVLRVSIPLRALEAFVPDAIVAAIPEAARVLAQRSRLPSGASTEPRSAPTPTAPPAPAPVPSGSLLDTILAGGRETRDPALDEFVRRVAEPAVERAPAGLGEWQAMIDGLLADQLREILYSPRFRALEMAWRGLHRLVAACETGPGLAIEMLDVPLVEAASVLAEEAGVPGAPRFAALVADYAFGPEDEDLGRLREITETSARLGAPLVAQAAPSILGLDDARELGDASVRERIGKGARLAGWHAFRTEALARHVALCAPRLLLRLPYGPKGERVESFTFDEGLAADEHEGFAWGSAALAFGTVLGRALATDGPGAALDDHAALEGLPVHVLPDGSMLPCAEVLMSEATIAAVASQGVIPLASFRDQDVARFYGIGTAAGTALRVG